jgi:ABC-type phosphate transport system ATPase subunit
MTTKLSDLSVSEVKDIEKKAEKAFKKLIKVKSCLSKGIVPISEEQIQNLTIAGDIYKAPHEIILRCIRVYVDAVCNGDIKEGLAELKISKHPNSLSA